MFGKWSGGAAADDEGVVEEGNPDDAAAEKSGTGVAPPLRPCICHAQLGKELASILLSVALSWN